MAKKKNKLERRMKDSGLSPTEKNVIRRIMGNGRTIDEVAKELSYSKSIVYQIEKRALAKLQNGN